MELCEQVRQGNQEKLLLLLECGANVDALDYNLRTALHQAAMWGRDDCVDLLVEKKANVNAQNVSAGPRAKRRPPRLCSARAAAAAPLAEWRDDAADVGGSRRPRVHRAEAAGRRRGPYAERQGKGRCGGGEGGVMG